MRTRRQVRNSLCRSKLERKRIRAGAGDGGEVEVDLKRRLYTGRKTRREKGKPSRSVDVFGGQEHSLTSNHRSQITAPMFEVVTSAPNLAIWPRGAPRSQQLCSMLKSARLVGRRWLSDHGTAFEAGTSARRSAARSSQVTAPFTVAVAVQGPNRAQMALRSWHCVRG